MRYNRKFSFSLLVLGFLISCTWAAAEIPEDILEAAKNATVLIITGNADSSIKNGSGFFVEPDKIVTNIHVVAGKRMVFVVGTEKVYNIEKITGYDPERDLVVLEVSGESEPLELSKGKIGESIFVVGYPGGGYKVTEGKIHGIRNSDKELRLVSKGFPANKGDSLLAPGVSGGPALNSKGQVVGVVFFSSNGFSFASDLSDLKALSDSFEENLVDWQKKDPIRAYAYSAWANRKLEDQNYNEATKGFEKTIESYQKYAKFWREYGIVKAELGQYQDAIETYEKAIKLISDDFIAYHDLGNAKQQSADYKGAIQAYNKALKLNPDDTATYFNRGIAKASDRDYKGAMRDYEKTIELKPGDALLAKVYYNLGDVKLKSTDYKGAIESYTQAINLNSKNADAYFYRGVANIEKSDSNYKKAIQDYEKIINLNPDNAIMLGEAYYELGNARKALGKDESAKLDHAKAYYYEGKANFNIGQYKAAIKSFDKSIELNPDYVEAYYDRGNAKLENEDYKKAIKDYKKVIDWKPDYAEVYYKLGMTHSHLNNYKMALDHFDRVIKLKPKFVEAYYNRGKEHHLRGKEGDYQKAVEDYTQAIKLKEDFADAYLGRGLANKKSGQVDAAKEDFTRVHYLSGMEAYKRGEYRKAVESFDKILELLYDSDPAPPHVYDALGRTKSGMGNFKADLGDLEAARRLYQEAIENHDKAIRGAENSQYY
ncbi:MAG: tetratricopeptide repeat protein [Candidatus Poribacteria bacterium]|nr:tetratricopeptide repeat protein [Candidatus Poribacteria bacterium]